MKEASKYQRHGLWQSGAQFVSRQASDLLDLVYPPACGLCGLPAETDDKLICQRCWDQIEGLGAPYCATCRQLLPDKARCLTCPPSSLTVFTIGYYHSDLQEIIHDMKFGGLKPLAAALGRRLAVDMEPRWKECGIDLVVPVPLHHSRHQVRGFNQSAEIGRALARHFDLPFNEDIIYSARKTRQQSKLPASRREANVRGAFAVEDKRGGLRGKTVLIVDDVTTTGATLRENQRIILEAGARSVFAATAASAV